MVGAFYENRLYACRFFDTDDRGTWSVSKNLITNMKRELRKKNHAVFLFHFSLYEVGPFVKGLGGRMKSGHPRFVNSLNEDGLDV